VIYIDSSVALARLFFERRSPPEWFWRENLVSSRLLEYEVWNRVHAYGLTGSHTKEARELLRGIELVEMGRPALARALEPLPVPVRTLDALHLATIDFVRRQADILQLASYDNRLSAAAQALGIPLAAL
jgi:predicted nucleic acid-binding protein